MMYLGRRVYVNVSPPFGLPGRDRCQYRIAWQPENFLKQSMALLSFRRVNACWLRCRLLSHPYIGIAS